jgi:hypothetical protein
MVMQSYSENGEDGLMHLVADLELGRVNGGVVSIFFFFSNTVQPIIVNHFKPGVE